jgi:hypothetical protein
MHQIIQHVVCASLWTLSLALMVVSTTTSQWEVLGWALLVALSACVVSAWLIVDSAVRRERIRVERLAEIFADVASSPVSRIR